jgi:hypothetical protein
MNKDQYRKRFLELESQMNNIRRTSNKLKSDYLSHSPFKKGDKVMVKTKKEELVCFILDVEVDYKYDYRYKFADVKKDGTMSGRSNGLYSYESVTLTNSEPDVAQRELSVASKDQSRP